MLIATVCCRAPQGAPRAASDEATIGEEGRFAAEPRFSMPPVGDSRGDVQPTSAEVPIDAHDAIWGDAAAPVTIVVFTDLECSFCADGHSALSELGRKYGHQRLRIAVKHCPLSMHPQAIPAARVGQAVLKLGGRAKFFDYLDLAFANPRAVQGGAVVGLAASLGLDAEQVRDLAESESVGAQILEDVTLANRLGVAATPHYRINGRPLTGALPADSLAPYVEEELRAARALRKRGVSPTQIYARRVTANVADED